MTRATLIVSTFNWKEALAVTLASAARQSVAPGEVIVADDGSRDDTGDLVRGLARDYPVPLHHVWQPDQGFRLARIRNRAMAEARGPWIIQVDGDLVLHHRFLEDHLGAARPGCFVRGPRVFLPPGQSAEVLAGRARRVRPWTPGIRKRWSALRWPWLDRRLRDHGVDDLRGHFLGFWLDDAVRVNGFEERFEGWGREDDEFARRLMNAGIRKRRLRFSALTYHLYHPERPREALGRNEAILEETRRTGRIRAERGLAEVG